MSESTSRNVADAEGLKAIVEGQARAWAEGDADAIAGRFAERCEFIVPGLHLTDPDQVRRAALDYFAQFSDTSVEIRRLVVQGDTAAVEWHWRHVNRQTGEATRADDAIVLQVAGGKIVYWREYIDTVSRHSAACAPPPTER